MKGVVSLALTCSLHVACLDVVVACLVTVVCRYAIAVGSLSKYEGTQKKIEMGYKYKVKGRYSMVCSNWGVYTWHTGAY